jgi:D-threo-aldose 1-dehydrogenase
VITDDGVSNGPVNPAGDVSALGFGCAELFRLPSARARRGVLDAAFDVGVTHFDVAPMYGLGAAEHEVGRFARLRRDRIVLATKFGIGVTRSGRVLGRVQGPLRRVLEARPGLKARARSGAAGPSSGLAGALLYASSGYGPSVARASLERSLRALRTDHVDLFLLHDPTADGLIVDGVGEYLERARDEGLIRAWGLAGEPASVPEVARRLDVSPEVVQIRDDIFVRSLERLPESVTATRITFGSLGSAVGRIAGYVQRHPDARDRWRRLVGRDCGDPEVVASLLLRYAWRRNPSGITLFSTIHPKRLRQAAAAVSSAALDVSVAVFVALVDAEIAATTTPDVGA